MTHHHKHHKDRVSGELYISKSGTIEIEIPFYPEEARAEIDEIPHPFGCGPHHHNHCHVEVVRHHHEIFLKIHWSVNSPQRLKWWARKGEVCI